MLWGTFPERIGRIKGSVAAGSGRELSYFSMAPRGNKSSSAASSVTLQSAVQEHLRTEVNWVASKGKYHGFKKHAGLSEDNDVEEVIEYSATGVVRKAFLQAEAMSHAIFVDMDRQEVDQIKRIVKTVPNFQEQGYRWPFDGMEAKFTSKENLSMEYENVWDGRGIDVHDVDSRVALRIEDIEEGSKVFVEHAITPYSGKKARANIVGFELGATLELLSVGLLERPDRKFDFESPRKKRRMA